MKKAKQRFSIANNDFIKLSEEEKYIVIGIEDGWLKADKDTLKQYYQIIDKVNSNN